jgi:hypothetical protein
MNFRDKNLRSERIAHDEAHRNGSARKYLTLLLEGDLLFFIRLQSVLHAELSQLVKRGRVSSFLQFLRVTLFHELGELFV